MTSLNKKIKLLSFLLVGSLFFFAFVGKVGAVISIRNSWAQNGAMKGDPEKIAAYFQSKNISVVPADYIHFGEEDGDWELTHGETMFTHVWSQAGIYRISIYDQEHDHLTYKMIAVAEKKVENVPNIYLNLGDSATRSFPSSVYGIHFAYKDTVNDSFDPVSERVEFPDETLMWHNVNARDGSGFVEISLLNQLSPPRFTSSIIWKLLPWQP